MTALTLLSPGNQLRLPVPTDKHNKGDRLGTSAYGDVMETGCFTVDVEHLLWLGRECLGSGPEHSTGPDRLHSYGLGKTETLQACGINNVAVRINQNDRKKHT